LPHLQITKDGESPTITSPEMTKTEVERQRDFVQDLIDRQNPEHDSHMHRASAIDLGWCQIGSHVIRGVEIVKEAADA
jgi:hypothetical protein